VIGSRRSQTAALIAELGHHDPVRREDALVALAASDLLSRPEVLAALVEVAARDEELPALRTSAALQAVFGSSGEAGLDVLEDLAAAADPELRWRAVGALAGLAPAVPDLVQVVEAATRDEAPVVREHAARALAGLAPSSSPRRVLALTR
jgi:HEAT repeat protein